MGATFFPEEVDLELVVEDLEELFALEPPRGYLPGRTVFRDAVASRLGCSQLQAEELVDTLIGRGYLRYDGSTTDGADGLDPWRIVRAE